MPITPFGWVDNASPDITAANLESMHSQAGAYMDSIIVGSTGLLFVVGHSHASGGGSQDLANRWPSRVAAWLGAQEVNEAIGGSVCGWTDNVKAGGVTWVAQRVRTYRRSSPYYSPLSAAIVHFGTNDMNNLGMAT